VFLFLVFSCAYGLSFMIYDMVCSRFGTQRTPHLSTVDHAMYAAFVLAGVDLGKLLRVKSVAEIEIERCAHTLPCRVLALVWLIITAVVAQSTSPYLSRNQPFPAAVVFLLLLTYLTGAVSNLIVGMAALVYGERRIFEYVRGTTQQPIASGKPNKPGKSEDDNPENITHIVVRRG
jgi:hypothetical protein